MLIASAAVPGDAETLKETLDEGDAGEAGPLEGTGVADPETMRADPGALDLVGRMAGPTYVGLDDLVVL